MNTVTIASADYSYDYSVKFVLIGDLCVGKTTFLNTFLSGYFNPTTKTTNFRGCKNKVVEYGEKRVRLQIWDTEGQEKYRSLTASYYRGAHACLIFYDVAKLTTFENVKNWYSDLLDFSCQLSEIPTILVGMVNNGRERNVPKDRAERFGISHNIPYMEVDTRNDQHSVNSVVYKLVSMVIESYKRNPVLHNSAKCINIVGRKTSQSPAKNWCAC